MQRGRRLPCVFPHYHSALFVRRAHLVSTITIAPVSPYHTAYYTAKRHDSQLSSRDIPKRSSDGVSAVSFVTCESSTGEVLDGSTSVDIDWDDATVVEEIKVLLCTLLASKEEGRHAKVDSHAVVTLTELFHALGPALRHQIQNSSFTTLLKALRSRPDWFRFDADGKTVGLTSAACKEYNIRDVNSILNTLSTASLTSSQTTTTTRTATSSSSLSLGRRNSTTAAITKTKSYVLVRGTVAATPLDVSRPPVTAAEAETWRLSRLLMPLALPFLLTREPITLFPRGGRLSPLAPELEEAEELYRIKGLFPPSEVAAAFVHITPTFFVETRHVLNAMSPEVAQSFEQHISRDSVVDVFFKKYPMIFKLKVAKFQKSAVKLNIEFAFIRNYPGCGRADRLLRRYNQEYRATVGGVLSRVVPSSSFPPLSSASTAPGTSSSSEELNEKGRPIRTSVDAKIFEILVRNLPRVATDPRVSPEELEERRCQPFSLVEWIHSFPQEDLDILNSVPQQRTLTLLTRYTRIFQLMCSGEDSNIFVEHKYLKTRKNTNNRQHSGGNECGEHNARLGSMEVNLESMVNNNDTDKTFFSHNEVVEEDGNKEEVKIQSAEKSSSASNTDLERREANITSALRDDLIGMDDFLTGTAGSVSPPLDGVANMEMDESTEKLKEMDEEEGDDPSSDSLEDEGMTTARATTTRTSPVHEEPSTGEDDANGLYIPSRYDILYVRRLPKHIAARSLSDYNSVNSPEPELLRYIASFLNPPPSLWNISSLKARGKDVLFARNDYHQWRWVPVQRIYASLNREQKRLLRPYKGLVHFMRLHGEVFELSADYLHVIAHDPQGKIPPFVPTQTTFYTEDRVLLPSTLDDDENSKASLIGDAERKKFERILGASQIPTDRQQLILLDPFNPLLDHEVLCEEVSFFMPDHPVSIHQLMSRLPPMLKAALSTRHKNNFKTSKHLTVWMDNNRMMLQRSQLALPEYVSMAREELPVEDAIECVREVVPDEGVMITSLSRMLPAAAKSALKQHFGNVYNALLGYPQYFYIEKVEGYRSNSVVFLVERLQEER